MTSTHYYTATSLDGFIATEDHSLDWLLSQDNDPNGPMAYLAFEERIGALAMGASTYQWLPTMRTGTGPMRSRHGSSPTASSRRPRATCGSPRPTW